MTSDPLYPSLDPDLLESFAGTQFPIGESEYFSQPNDWTCGPSVYVMARRWLKLAERSLDEIVAEMRATPDLGSSTSAMERSFARMAEEAGCHCEYGDDTLTDQLRELYRRNFLIVVNFVEPVGHVGHYSIAQCFSDKGVLLADPGQGRLCALPYSKFERVTRYETAQRKNWYLALGSQETRRN